MTLTEFLLARIAEAETSAQGAHDFDRPHWSACGYFGPDYMGGGECDCGYAARVLAECEAKRRIVELSAANDNDWGVEQSVRLLAAIYADHPDYREEWKP